MYIDIIAQSLSCDLGLLPCTLDGCNHDATGIIHALPARLNMSELMVAMVAMSH